MRYPRFIALVGTAATVLVASLLLQAWQMAEVGAVVSGLVRDESGPVAGASVRFQGNDAVTITDGLGRFRLKRVDGRSLTAWCEGYAIGSATADRATILLDKLPSEDNEAYHWVDPAPDPSRPNQCGNCHGEIYREWSSSPHARAASNRRLLNLVQGKDWHGRPSKSWSLRHEHPYGASVCASCHAPTFSDPTLEYDLGAVVGVASKGVHCDLCHKIEDVVADPRGLQFGRDGLKLLRPSDGTQLFFGPLQDAVRPGEMFAYAGVYEQSRYCASCHQGTLFGVKVYDTYNEWLASPAARRGVACQDCHMAPTGSLTNIAPGRGGVSRDPTTLASHIFAGGSLKMLQRGVRLLAHATRKDSCVKVTVSVSVQGVGHRVPTGFIDRNVVLVVDAVNKAGRRLPPVTGSRLPGHAGKSVAGRAGQLYAKQYLDADDDLLPFWQPGGRIRDTRLEPGIDRRSFAFPVETDKVRVRLLYRRFWPSVAASKSWPENETTVYDLSVEVE